MGNKSSSPTKLDLQAEYIISKISINIDCKKVSVSSMKKSSGMELRVNDTLYLGDHFVIDRHYPDMIDYLLDYDSLSKTIDDEDCNTKWIWAYHSYLDKNKLEQLNCKGILRPDDKYHLVAISRIRKGDTLKHAFGFGHWLCNRKAIPLLNANNIRGYIKFLEYWLSESSKDPYYKAVRRMYNILKKAFISSPSNKSFDEVIDECFIVFDKRRKSNTNGKRTKK